LAGLVAGAITAAAVGGAINATMDGGRGWSGIPVASSCFGIPIQLFNHHGKFLCGGIHKPHGHHNPNHGFNQSSWWYIEPFPGFTDKVRLRNMNGKYLCHEGRSQFCSMHSSPSHSGVSWHMESYPGYSGQNVMFRSHGGHFLGCDVHDDLVHCKQHFLGNAHANQRFEIRYIQGYPPVSVTTTTTVAQQPVQPVVQQQTTTVSQAYAGQQAYATAPVMPASAYAPQQGYATPPYGSQPGYGYGGQPMPGAYNTAPMPGPYATPPGYGMAPPGAYSPYPGAPQPGYGNPYGSQPGYGAPPGGY
jgi:hypothetical protein